MLLLQGHPPVIVLQKWYMHVEGFLLFFFLNWQIYKAINFQRRSFLLCITTNYTTMYYHFEKNLFKSVSTADFLLQILANTTH